MLFFYGMMATTENIARKAKTKRVAKNSATPTQNLQVVAISVASYEADTGHLPPTTSPDALKNALSPKFLTDTSVLNDGSTGKPFWTNPDVSEKKRSAFKSSQNVPLLATEPDAMGTRTVLLLSGEVRDVHPVAWKVLSAPQKPQPAPAGKSVPVTSPAPSPR